MSGQILKVITPKQSLASATRTASANGTGVDTMGYNEVIALLDVGAVSGTLPTLDVKLQEADASGGTYTDISGAAFAQITTANHALSISVNIGDGTRKRFIRAVATIGGTSPSFACAVALLLAKPGLLPAAAGA